MELEEFIGRLLQLVEVELNFDFAKHGKIREQIHGMCVLIHLGNDAKLYSYPTPISLQT